MSNRVASANRLKVVQSAKRTIKRKPTQANLMELLETTPTGNLSEEMLRFKNQCLASEQLN